MPQLDRRTFTAASAALAASTATAAASNQIRLGIIGTGNRGQQLIAAFKPHSDAKLVAACDVFKPHREKAKDLLGSDLETCEDFRQLIDRKDLDGIIVATPDHWHAIQTIAACKAGKDVYCEKPL